MSLIVEAIVVGISVMVLGMLMHLIASKFMSHDMNDNKVLAVHFLIIGAVFHLLAEVSGVNKWYCNK